MDFENDYYFNDYTNLIKFNEAGKIASISNTVGNKLDNSIDVQYPQGVSVHVNSDGSSITYKDGVVVPRNENRRLEVSFGIIGDRGNNEEYKEFGGNRLSVIAEIENFNTTELGKNIFSKSGVLNIYPQNDIKSIEAPINGTNIMYNGEKPFAIAHEIGHTKFGGGYIDNEDSIYDTDFPKPPHTNVQNNENIFRRTMGIKNREWYVELSGEMYYTGDANNE